MEYNVLIKDVTGEEFPAYVGKIYSVVEILHTKNGCCAGAPILITENTAPDGSPNYSAQCACGGWCTSGQSSAAQAADAWQHMRGNRPARGRIRSTVLSGCFKDLADVRRPAWL